MFYLYYKLQNADFRSACGKGRKPALGAGGVRVKTLTHGLVQAGRLQILECAVPRAGL